MLVNKAAGREWIAADFAGIDRSLFRNNESGGRSSVVRLIKNSLFPRHRHTGTEEVAALSGTGASRGRICRREITSSPSRARSTMCWP